MSGAQYLYRRDSGTYYIRLCVPARLKVAVGKGEIHRTTGCRDYRLAKIVAAELAAHWHRAIQALERMDISKIKAGSIKLLGDGYIPLTDAAEALGTTPSSLAQRLTIRQAHFFVEANDWLGWAVEDIHESLEHIQDELGQVEVVIDANKMGGPAAQRRFSGLLRIRFPEEVIAMVRTNQPAGLCQFLLWPSPDRGFVCDLPGQPVDSQMLQIRRIDVEAMRLDLAAQLTPDMLASAHPTLPQPDTTTTLPTPSTGMTFLVFRDEYLKRNAGFWKADQVRRRQDQFEAFLELMGDLQLAKIDRATIRTFSDEIAKIPDERHNVRRKFKRPDADYQELIELAEKHNLPRLTVSAQQRMLDGISEIFAWAERETLITSNPAKGLGGELKKRSGSTKVKAHEQRDPLSDVDLQKIFSAVWFTTGSGLKTAKGKFYTYRPHYFWLPLLAIYHGGRLNELSQLYLDDIKTSESGVPYLDFNLLGEDKMDVDEADRSAATDKSLKTVSSQRVVPMHKHLVDLGFREYVSALRDAGYKRLFPELRFNKAKGYGKAAGSWFNERFLGKELGIPRNGRKTFHSMRHNFATALGATATPTTIKSDLMGHSRGLALVEARYDKGGDLLERKKVIDAIQYALPPIAHFNIKDGIQAIKDALKTKESHKKTKRYPS
ncbi:site-specific integrase [Polaromonas sp. JS666]|uniref:site-specific integrase n=1 Tax=Polaromonas sp. (strain JS666 / ATCC BAA-500) TaxID=296591 RepID=UPI0000D5B3C1|nr:site-specific integrase [Polaromonas sp. JS666]ABE43884.1 putative integrase [Polaromonas sp. JS666]